jgi:hypothetical protein
MSRWSHPQDRPRPMLVVSGTRDRYITPSRSVYPVNSSDSSVTGGVRLSDLGTNRPESRDGLVTVLSREYVGGRSRSRCPSPEPKLSKIHQFGNSRFWTRINAGSSRCIAVVKPSSRHI